MRLLHSVVLALSLLATSAQDTSTAQKQKHDYQSDVARLRKIVINSLYSHKEVFLRELISNANDAIEKLRLTSLKDKSIWDGVNPLNITIKAVKDEDGKGGRIIITDTGIGMTAEELTANLGTLAKSGTSDFLAKIEQDASSAGNLIGAFGVGFYSSFLVADRVYVASVPPNSNEQYVFSSSVDDSSFETYPDPRGNTIGRGTEITLVLKDDSLEYLDTNTLTDLVNKHSSFSSSFPIYLHTERIEQVPDEEAVTEESTEEKEEEPKAESDEDEATVEETKEEEKKPEPKMKDVTVQEWVQLNSQAPIWTRDPKTVTKEEYKEFYTATFKETEEPLAWHHFSAEAGNGVNFRAILYIPGRLAEDYWQQPLATQSKDIRLMVKRTFITSDLGEDGLPKWASWLRVVIDAEDLDLNVSRETLQSTKFLKQLKQVIIKRLIQTISKLSEDKELYNNFLKTYGSVLKLGSVEDLKNRDKLTPLTRWTTTQRNVTSLDEYIENKKKGQKQIYYISEMGKSPEELAKSIFVEKLHARGYEVLLLGEPIDEILVGNTRKFKTLPFQDVAKAGLKYGDEDADAEEEKAQLKQTQEKYKPLIKWLKDQVQDTVRDVVISNRLVTSPCAVVADMFGYTANVQKMVEASNKKDKGAMHEFAKKQRVLEINPRSPLIEGLLKRVEDLSTDEEDRDLEAEEEVKEIASILIDSALVRSGFEVTDSNSFFTRVDRVLRRSLGVSETAPTDDTVKPAPPVDPEMPTEEELAKDQEDQFPSFMKPRFKPEFEEEDDGKPKVILPDHMKDKMSIEMEELADDDDGLPVRDEL